MADAPAATHRWFRLTPDRLILGLVAAEAILFLADWFRWFPKGWAVLIAIASVGAAFLLMACWYAASLSLRWRFQFSIRSLLVLVVVVAIPSSWLATAMRNARRQEETVERIGKTAGHVSFDYELDQAGRYKSSPEPPGPRWLASLIGVDFLAEVVYAEVGTDAGMSRLGSLSGLRRLLVYRDVSDTGLVYVATMPRLEGFEIVSDRVTDEGIVWVRGLSRLRKLRLECPHVGDAGINNVNGLVELESLALVTTAVTDAGLARLGRLHRLRELILTGSPVTGAGLRRLGGLPSLARLDVDGTPATDEGLRGIGALTSLQDLNLGQTRIGDAGLRHLAALRGLRAITLYNTRITDAGLRHLERLRSLSHLDVSNTAVSRAGVDALRRVLPRCEVLGRYGAGTERRIVPGIK